MFFKYYYYFFYISFFVGGLKRTQGDLIELGLGKNVFPIKVIYFLCVINITALFLYKSHPNKLQNMKVSADAEK